MSRPESFAALKPSKPNDLEGNPAAVVGEEEILSQFSPEEQKLIRERMRLLSLIPNHIGKDFEMKVELNAPGEGWHWNFAINHVRVDPKDLLEKPLDWCRQTMAHEGGHRRVSRTDFIPKDVWGQPGFSSMMNAIEDPRMENFVSEAYPPYRKLQKTAYEHDLESEKRMKEKAGDQLGRQPRFMQAGFEYIKQWFKQTQGKPFELSADLPDDVRAVVEKTLKAAEDSWLRYPTRDEADKSEEVIKAYAEKSYEINRDRVWPDFKNLVEQDIKDQEIPEFLKDLMKGEGKPETGQGEGLSPQDVQDIKDAVKAALGEKGEGKPVPPGALSEELKQKIQAAFDALPEDKKREIMEAARSAIKELADEFAAQFEGEYIKAGEPAVEPEPGTTETEGKAWSEAERTADDTRREMRRRMEESLERGEGDPYREALTEMASHIDALTGDLRDVFVKRKMTTTESGYRSGRRWNIRTRIKERIADIPLIKTQSREQPESSGEETDYAFLLQIDLSGSMSRGNKIEEAFKAIVLLSETLNNLNIHFEIDGFQDLLLEFKRFEEQLDESMRLKLNQLLLEVENKNPSGHNNAGDNDDGACLREASQHLANQTAREKILIVLSDGQPAMDSGRKGQGQLDRELKEVIREIRENTDQKLIGVGINSSAVSTYYENNLPNVDAKELAETLGEILRSVIERN
ncbi:MAG: hypothetical protein NUV54_01185 [Candidatus Taylorbacteria bacterium]|nr:hypothetical protein [Candidatus Taylorbacteria bacterium]